MKIKTDPNEFKNYLVDAANFKGHCTEVHFPENESEVIDIVRKTNEKKTLLTIAGNHTGLTGAGIPQGGFVISTEKLNKVIEINTAENYAILQPGVILKDFHDIVESINLFYPPDPTEKNCFIGATVATNASGANSFKYGSTRNYVLGLNIILPDGEKIYLQRGKLFANGHELSFNTESGKRINIKIPDYQMPKVKHAAGYYCHENMDVIDLFIGSEGTLGIITELKLKLMQLPSNVLSSVIFFDDEIDALNFIERARKLSYRNRENTRVEIINACGLEFFDYYSLQFLYEDYTQIPLESHAAVWFEQDFITENEHSVLQAWIQLIQRFNGDEQRSWFAVDKKERQTFQDFRHAVSWKVNEYIAEHNLMKVGTDIAVPENDFVDFYFYAKSKANDSGIKYLCYGHFGNSHLHLNMLPKNQEQYKLAKSIYSEICKRAVELKGTISAEHGIGKMKKEYLMKMYGEKNIRKMAQLKKALDPNLILGIDNIFDKKYLQ